ncbi:MAG: YifB family Mg chelatase-like AAA ATPase [Pseudomonadota bacterium]
MELSVVYSRALAGLNAPAVEVETHLSNGLPAFNIVGLPETAVRESRDRVRSALLNSHFTFPDRRITVNLAPADLPKEGGRFDLPIALGILAASGQVDKKPLGNYEFIGELALDGSLRPVPGAVAAAASLRDTGRKLVAAPTSALLASRVDADSVLSAPDLLSLCAHLAGRETLPFPVPQAIYAPTAGPDLADIQGQLEARRALEIAAAGGHHILFCGPPGTGKTLLASRLPSILPPPDSQEAVAMLAVRDVAGQAGDPADTHTRPFRNPHHSASAAALVGGGSRPRPGEISLAHAGVLFLDELPEFDRRCLEMLREPLEAGEITLSRARQQITYPARFQLVAAMNPCPCGYLGDADRHCRCTPDQIIRYRSRISGPLLDRIDLHVEVKRLQASTLLRSDGDAEHSAAVRERVIHCRQLQTHRQRCCNADLDSDSLLEVCALDVTARRQLEQIAGRLHLSGRGIYRTLRVARTVADLVAQPAVNQSHILQALALRPQ